MESEAGDQGYPGRLLRACHYTRWTTTTSSSSTTAPITDAPTVGEPHAALVLQSRGSRRRRHPRPRARRSTRRHFTPVDAALIPTGAFRGVRAEDRRSTSRRRVASASASTTTSSSAIGRRLRSQLRSQSTRSTRAGAARRRSRLACEIRRAVARWRSSRPSPGIQFYSGNGIRPRPPGKGRLRLSPARRGGSRDAALSRLAEPAALSVDDSAARRRISISTTVYRFSTT